MSTNSPSDNRPEDTPRETTEAGSQEPRVAPANKQNDLGGLVQQDRREIEAPEGVAESEAAQVAAAENEDEPIGAAAGTTVAAGAAVETEATSNEVDGDATGQSPTPGTGDELLGALLTLRKSLSETALPLDVPGAGAARANLASLAAQLDDYVIPRMRELEAPLLAVVGGSTGAGKSTLVNSIVGREVTRASVIRPTTRSPVLVHHPDDEACFLSDRVLPSLARLTGDPTDTSGMDRASALRLVPAETLLPGLALLDAPDIDSVVQANRELAAQLLSAADLWLFVTTAARYADAVPWALLRTAAERGTSVAVVLDRVPPEAMSEVRTDLATMLRDHGLSAAPLFTISEHPTDQGMLSAEQTEPLRRWLGSLASDAKARSVVVRRTLSGVLDSFTARVAALAVAAEQQTKADTVLRSEVARSFQEADRALERSLTDGSLLRGEVLARWQDLVGTGELFRGLESAVGRIRDRITARVTGRKAPAEPLGEALTTGVSALVRAQAEEALERAVSRWQEHPAGQALLAEIDPAKLSLGPSFDDRLERLVRDWQRYVFDLVKAEGENRRSYARMLSFGVNALGVVLMLVVFASTAFIPTGAEVGVAAGSAVVGQKLLEAVFGDQAVRALATKARTDLVARVDALMDDSRQVLISQLDRADVDPEIADRLRDAGEKVQVTR